MTSRNPAPGALLAALCLAMAPKAVVAEEASPEAWVAVAKACLAVVESGDPAGFDALGGLYRSDDNRHGGITVEAVALASGEMPTSEEDPLIYLTYFYNPSGPGGHPVNRCDVEMPDPAGAAAADVAAALANWAEPAGFAARGQGRGFSHARCIEGDVDFIMASDLETTPLLMIGRLLQETECVAQGAANND